MRIPIIKFFHEELAKQGILTVKFDFPGMGFINGLLRIPVLKADLLQSYRRIIDETRKAHGPGRLYIGGVSLGAYITALLTAQDPQLPVDGLFFFSYPLGLNNEGASLLNDVSKQMFFVAGTKDPMARRDRLDELLKKLGSKATVHWVADGDHLLNPHRGRRAYRESLELVAGHLVDWSQTSH